MAEVIKSTDLIYLKGARQICVTSGGTIYVLFEAYISGTYYYEIWENSSGWALATQQSSTTVHGASGVTGTCSMVIDGSDDLHVFCISSPGGQTRDLAYRVFDTATDTWVGSWIEIASFGTTYTYQFIAPVIDSSDVLHVVYGAAVKDMGTNYAQLLYINNSSGWSSPEQLTTDGLNYGYNRMGIDGSDNLYLYYHRNNTAWCYNKRTSGSWGTEHTESPGYRYVFGSNVPWDGSNSWGIGVDTAETIWTKNETSNAVDTTLDTGTDTDRDIDITYINSEVIIAVEVTDQIKTYKWSGSAWNFDRNVTDGLAESEEIRLAYQYNNWNGGNHVYIMYLLGGDLYFDDLFGTNTDPSSVSALAWGGGLPTDSKSAFLEGGPNRGSVGAFINGGYDVGGDTRSAIHVSVPTKNPSIPCYMKGDKPVYFDVVNFTAKTSTGTQDITGSLGGLEPTAAIIFGAKFDTNRTAQNDIGMFAGYTDGINEVVWHTYHEDGSGSSATFGDIESTWLVGSDYGSWAGVAAFEQWLADGIQINYSVAASASWKYGALLMASGAPETIQAKVGTVSWSPEDDDTIDITDIGFEPDLIIWIADQYTNGGAQNFGVTHRSPVAKDANPPNYFAVEVGDPVPKILAFNWDYGTTYAWPSYGGYGDIGFEWDNRCMIDIMQTVYLISNVSYWDEDKVTITCQSGNGTLHTYGYLALKFESPAFMYLHPGTGDSGEDVASGGASSTFTRDTGNDDVPKFKPQVVFGATQAHGWGYDNELYADDSGSGLFMTDNEHDWSASVSFYHWVAWDCRTYGADDRALALLGDGDRGWPVCLNMTSTSFDATSWTFTNETAVVGNPALISIAFGTVNEAEPSSVPCYMFAQSPIRSAFMSGHDHVKSSVPAFFNVVDAQEDIPAYMQGLDPSRTSIPAYCQGKDDTIVAMVDFAANTSDGNQDITTIELCGETPKACIIFWSGIGKDGAWGSHGEFTGGISMTDGTTHVYNLVRGEDDLYEYFDVYNYLGNGYVVQFPLTGGLGSGGIGAWNSFITNGIRINWTTAPATALRGMAIFFAGSDVDASLELREIASGAGSLQYAHQVSYLNDDVITLGFEAKMAFAMGLAAGWKAATSDNFQGGGWNFGVATKNSKKWNEGSWDEVHGDSWNYVWRSGKGTFSGPCNTVYPDPLMFDGNDVNDAFGDGWFSDGWISDWGATTATFSSCANIAGQDRWWPILFVGLGAGREAMSFNHIIESFYAAPNLHTVEGVADVDYDMHNPEAGIFLMNPDREIVRNGEDTWQNYDNNEWIASQSISFLTSAYQACMVHSNWLIRWDCSLQFYDQYCNSMLYSDRLFHHWANDYDVEETYKDFDTLLTGTGSFVKNGIAADITTVGDPMDYYYVLSPDMSVRGWMVGQITNKGSTPAFLHGERADWPSRTPRGCYLEGSQALQTSDTPAFMQVGPASSVPVYIDGFVEGKAVSAGYLAGVDTDLDSISAFVPSQVFTLTDNDAYTKGQDTFSGSQEGFVWGKGLGVDAVPAYLEGGIEASSSTSAWCRSGTDVEDSQSAFLQGVESTSSVSAFTDGFSATPTSSTLAFTNGGGPWPFTDDYTGADEDPWNPTKWISTEEA